MADTASLADILAQLQASTGSVSSDYVRPDYINVDNPNLYNIQQIQDQLGIKYTYDRGEIEKILQDAVNSEYAIRYQEQANAERGYNKNMATAQNTALETARQLQGQAIIQGATKGMQAANTLSTILGVSQQGAEEATQLAMDRQLLGKEKGAAQSAATSSALDKANAAFEAAANIQHQLYADEIQKYAAQLGYNTGINTDYAGYSASKYNADSTARSSVANTAAGVYNNNTAQNTALLQALEAAAAQRDVANTNYAASAYNADANAAATKYAADQSYAAILAQLNGVSTVPGNTSKSTSPINGLTEVQSKKLPRSYVNKFNDISVAANKQKTAEETAKAKAKAEAMAKAIKRTQGVRNYFGAK